MTIRVGVVGATGKMGRVVSAAVADDPELELVAGVSRHAGAPLGEFIDRPSVKVTVSDRLDALTAAKVDVAVDFTVPDAVMANARWYADHHLHAVIGTTGITARDIEEMRSLISKNGTNFVVAPDFSHGGAVLVKLAELAAKYFPEVEIIETKLPSKLDSPSGTSMNTARRIANARAAGGSASSREVVPGARGGEVDGVRVHSLRLSGPASIEEARFARPGEYLVISLTSLDRAPYVAGTLRAIKAVAKRPGFTFGFAPLLDPD